ncbi:MAG: DUF4845 domain-containing protein [Gammaproteobacteria bacterium]|nr:DUF4845 domain-containing protein [Gammaproteobacteria bacterium]
MNITAQILQGEPPALLRCMGRQNDAIGNSRYKQRGLGMLGMLVVMLIGGLLLTCVVKMAPVYIGNWNIKSILSDIEEQFQGAGPIEKEQIVKKIQKRMNIDMVDAITMNDIKVKKEKGRYVVTANYEKRVNLMGNVDIVMVFADNTVEIPLNSR